MTDYQLFLRESTIGFPEIYDHLEEYQDDDSMLLVEAGKEGVYKENYWLKKELQTKYIAEPLSKLKNQELIVEGIQAFRDSHTKQFSTPGPVYTFRFDEPELKFLYDIFQVTPDQLKTLYDQMIVETYEGGKISPFFTSWIRSAPHKVLFVAIQMEAAQHDYADMIEASEYLWMFTEYPIIYREFWKTGVKEDVMNYTIEHLSSKHKVTKMKNVFEMLKYDSHVATMSMMEAFKAGQDNTYSDALQRYRNQFKSKIKNIARAYFENSENNASSHNMTSEFDDGTRAEQEGHSTNQAQIIERTIAKFSENGPNSQIIRISADGSSVDRSNLTGYINQIYAAKNNRIPKMVEDIISSYFAANPTSVDLVNTEFLNFGLPLYRSLSNSKNRLYAEMRSILDQWLELINIRSDYGREATIISYARAIFNYFVFLINYYN